ncbi:MAG: flavin reductase [Defluviitaleaceae bacterium]|nr:flavin reductase [Defluviitaleaceae bacterium]
MALSRIEIGDLRVHPVEMFAKGWPLLTAGGLDGFNTMTISWGQIGSLWGSRGAPVMAVYVRPQRHTFGFMNAADCFSVSVLPEEFREQLGYLGRVSGRDEDKVAKAGLTPVFGDGYTYFEQAEMVFVCRKLYQSPILPEGFVDKELMERIYPGADFHTQYIGEIVEILAK